MLLKIINKWKNIYEGLKKTEGTISKEEISKIKYFV